VGVLSLSLAGFAISILHRVRFAALTMKVAIGGVAAWEKFRFP
jgi:hypothetical protein